MAATDEQLKAYADLNSARNAVTTSLGVLFEDSPGSGVPFGDAARPPTGSSSGADVADEQYALVLVKCGEDPRFAASWAYIGQASEGDTYDLEVAGTPVSYVAQAGDTIADISDQLQQLVNALPGIGASRFNGPTFDQIRIIDTVPNADGVPPTVTTNSIYIGIYTDATEVSFRLWGYLESVWYRLSDFSKTVDQSYMDLVGCSAYQRLAVQVTGITGRAEILIAPCGETGGGGGGAFIP